MPYDKQIEELTSIVTVLLKSGHLSEDDANDLAAQILSTNHNDDSAALMGIAGQLKAIINMNDDNVDINDSYLSVNDSNPATPQPGPPPEFINACSKGVITHPTQVTGGAVAKVMSSVPIIDTESGGQVELLDSGAVSEALKAEHKKIRQGNFSSMEDMLVNQTFLLNATFENIVIRSSESGLYNQAKLLPMALRCQTQARQTISTLAEVKDIKVNVVKSLQVDNRQHHQIENQQVNVNHHPQEGITATVEPNSPPVDDINHQQQKALSHEQLKAAGFIPLSEPAVLQGPVPVQTQSPEHMDGGIQDTAGTEDRAVSTPDFLK